MVKKIKNSPPASTPSLPTLQQQTVTKVASFSGPLPPPSALKEYNDVLPGLADKIVIMAETEAKHRHELDRETARQSALIINKEFAERRIGQIFGLCMGTLSLITSIVSVFLHAEKVAMVIGGSTVIGLVTVFVVGRIKKETPLQPEDKQ